LIIEQEGRNKKFLQDVEQITFSGKYAAQIGQPVLYVTERAVFKLTKDGIELTDVLPHMLGRKAGVVLTASSIAGIYGNMGQTNYAATKWAVIGMTKTWAKEMAKDGLRFNCVAPGVIATEMVMKIPEQVLKEKLLIKIPAGRLGKPEEIAAAYAFLASDDAQFINGAVLSIDGAMTI